MVRMYRVWYWASGIPQAVLECTPTDKGRGHSCTLEWDRIWRCGSEEVNEVK